jgi:hypothetical protein
MSIKIRLGMAAFAGLLLIDTNYSIAQSPRPQFLVQEIHFFREARKSIWQQIIVNVKSKEFSGAAAAIGTIFDIPPDETAAAVGLATSQIQSNIAGNEEHGIWRSPDGYTFCRVDLLSVDQMSPSSALNVRVMRTVKDDGLAEYDNVPVTVRGSKVEARFRITFVLADPPSVVKLTNDGKCMPQNFCPFQIGWKDRTLNVPNCVPADKRPDRWLNGTYPGGSHWPPGPGD